MGLSSDSRAVWESRHQHNGSFEGDNQALGGASAGASRALLTHSAGATLRWLGYSLITHTGGISGTHGFVYASAHPNGT